MADGPGYAGPIVEAMTNTRVLIAGVTGLLLLGTGCSGQTATAAAPATTAAAGSGTAKVLFLGDSIAAGEAIPLSAAFKASGVGFQSVAADGGGNVVGPFSANNWKKVPGQLAAARPTTVVYQITTYDWGTAQAQRTAYGKLAATVAKAGAKLVFVTAPPIKPDDFYRPHMADLNRTPGIARSVAAGSRGRAVLLDAGAVWGGTYRQIRDGKADRSTDGIHTCPQGAARFTNWLLGKLASMSPRFTPAAPRTWANTGWSGDARFKGC